MNSSRERSGGWWESPKQGHQAQPGVGPGGCPEQVGTPANLGETRRKTPNSDKGDVTTVAGSVRETSERLKCDVIGGLLFLRLLTPDTVARGETIFF